MRTFPFYFFCVDSLYIKDMGYDLVPAETPLQKKAISDSHLPFNLWCFKQTFRLSVHAQNNLEQYLPLRLLSVKNQHFSIKCHKSNVNATPNVCWWAAAGASKRL